jgi:hypothetical protein
MTRPIYFIWREVEVIDQQGVVEKRLAMVPADRYRRTAEREFKFGEYPLAVQEERSIASHRQYFAAIKDGFRNLPENISARFPSAEHLRKWALVETNWCDEEEFEMESVAHAKRLALYLRKGDDYARISVHGERVIVRKPKSQSISAMGKEPFQKSKRDVLDLIESMIRLPRGALMKNAR